MIHFAREKMRRRSWWRALALRKCGLPWVYGLSVLGLLRLSPAHGGTQEFVPPVPARDRAELRAVTRELLQLPSSPLKEAQEGREVLLQLLRAYRMYRGEATLTLRNAPYVPLLLKQKVGEIYPALYQKAYNQEHRKLVEEIQLESLLDGLLQAYLAKSLPQKLQRQASAVGPCLARRVLSAKNPACVLDPSDRQRKVSLPRIILHRFDCPLLKISSPCDARRDLFDYLKPELIEARQSQEVRAILETEFQKQFPAEFRKAFLSEMSERMKGFPALVSSKFGVSEDLFWTTRTPLVEGDRTGADEVSLEGFGEGLWVDAHAGSVLNRVNGVEQSAGAPLFFAAANRLLLMTGGEGARWDGERFQVVEPLAGGVPATGLPVFQSWVFGGWGAQPSGNPNSAIRFLPWDWASYDPTRTLEPSPYQWFPTQIRMGFQGEPLSGGRTIPEQRLSSLASLLEGVSEFLRVTRPEAEFGRFFGGVEEIEKLLDPKEPLLFPREGRSLAVGILAGVLKNLVAPERGHLQIEASNGLGIRFFDPVSFQGRSPMPVDTRSVARLLTVAAQLRETLAADPDVPAELNALAPQLDSALQIGALVLGAEAQSADGSFKERLGEADSGQRALSVQIEGIRALTAAHARTQTVLLLFRLKEAWISLDRFWGAGVYPTAPVPTSVLWSMIRLWQEAQPLVRPSLGPDRAPEIQWEKWEGRMKQLQSRLWVPLSLGRLPVNVP